MDGDQSTARSEGTSADLVADALALGLKASPRMVTDWVEAGLLANPEPRKTSAHGSDPRVFPPEQRELFTRLLQARERSPLGRVPFHTMIRIVLYLWVIDDTVVLTPQARRAWRTHARAAGRTTAAKRSKNARDVVDQLAHSEASFKQRRTAQLVIEEGEKTGRIDMAKLTSALTELCSPRPSQPGIPRIERALPGPFGPITVQHHIAMWHARSKTISQLRHEEIDESRLDQVRAVHRTDRADYKARRQAAADGQFAAYFAEPTTLEGRAIEEVDAFVGTLAGELGLIEAASYKAETARVRQSR
ncbi:hypothetical protein ACIBMX_41340 [Streptomyces phaeochromogenes]|uniref:hypothetical protein n=1 Tax=Streptomyces phaeochromogenes TaxID=1923 RepID=UPI00340FB3F8